MEGRVGKLLNSPNFEKATLRSNEHLACFGFELWVFQIEFLSCLWEKVFGKIFLNFHSNFLTSDVYFYMVTALGISAKHLPDMWTNLRADFTDKKVTGVIQNLGASGALWVKVQVVPYE